MTLLESSSVIVPGRSHAPPAGREMGRTVVLLRGEYDISTGEALWETLVAAMALDGADLVVDLRRVQFMEASTIGVLVSARTHLLDASRQLVLRAPGMFAQRVLDLCGLGHLVEAAPRVAARAAALASWAAMPAAGRADDHAEVSSLQPGRGATPIRAAGTVSGVAGGAGVGSGDEAAGRP